MTLTAATPRTIRPGRALRLLLTVNGVANLLGGAALLPFAGTLAPPTGLPPRLLAGVAVFYLGYGAAMWFAATRTSPRAAAILAVIAVNPVWAAVCLLLTGGASGLGAALLGAEAATVTTLAGLQFAAYRRR